MYLEKLRLFNFKNYRESSFDFSEQINCIVGKNGSGKTNLLDAIYFLSLTKSFIHNRDLLSITFDEEFSLLEGVFKLNGSETTISCNIQTKGGKTLLRDRKPYSRFSDHIGKFPVVLITPNDTDLIRDGAEGRRKLFDGIIAQISPQYLQNYLTYNKVLSQRNSLLKQFAEQNSFNADLLNIYTSQLIEPGKFIYKERKKFLASFLPVFIENYSALSDSNETVLINYESELEGKIFAEILKNNLETDLAAQRTTQGIHRDDFLFLMNNREIKRFGSQGQRKSFVLAIKLAQLYFIKSIKNLTPILLLDDIFDKLDAYRINQLIQLISQEEFGQVFITDAQAKRTQELLKDFKVNFIFIN